MSRPENLPDFNSPPLDEVVVGVQFAPASNYSSVFAKDVWGLFSDSYPLVQEQPAIEPSFETFGGPRPQPGMSFEFGHRPLQNRLWFVSDDQSHLIQFQNDRLLLNWRRRQPNQTYPRFEGIADAFQTHLNTLQGFFEASLKIPLDVNQAEVTYINNIPVDDYSSVGEWLRFWNVENIDVENVSFQFGEVIYEPGGRPYARLLHELTSVISRDGRAKAFRLSLIFRGKPYTGNSPADAMKFIHIGREKIVTRFAEMTTEKAHKIWERK